MKGEEIILGQASAADDALKENAGSGMLYIGGHGEGKLKASANMSKI